MAGVMRIMRWLRDEVYWRVIELGWTIAGEHGVGYLRRKSLEEFMDKRALELMRRIEEIIDSNNILSPGKIFIC